MSIYENVVARCKERKISISELERASGLGNATIAGWKTSYPRVDKIAAVASTLECKIDDLLCKEQ
ncbi:MAG: helix-turn-helix transcriptional regulator [Clostridia bacterium]|nr:helix-turn-helix transcriptional regulator [Clostridia bacterium]